MTRWPLAFGLSIFDRSVGIALGGLVLFIAFTMLRGDRVGVQVTRATPDGQAGRGSVVAIQFGEAMKRDSVAERLSFDPPLSGAISWSSSRLIYRPAEPLSDGAHYAVTLQSGAEAEGGRKLLTDLRFSFTVVGGRVAYLSPEEGSVRDIWMHDLSGGEPDRLTNSTFGVLAFDVSPDGSKIAFAEHKDTGAAADLKLLDLDTRELRPLTSCGEFVCTNPVWSPDGGRIAYERLSYNAVEPGFAISSTRVWLLDPSASSPSTSPLLPGAQTPPNYRPRWSPDGQRLAVSRLPLLPERNPGILVYNLADESSLFFPTSFGSASAFSPDGTRLIYPGFAVRGGEMRTVLQIADLQTSEVTEVPGVDAQAQESLADWKPDGSALVIARRNADGESVRGRQLYLMRPETGESQPLVLDPEYDHSFFAWDSSGQMLVLERSLASTGSTPGEQQIRSQVWTYDTASGALSLVAANAFHPRWVP
jgi:Tol biopolymer transport system component